MVGKILMMVINNQSHPCQGGRNNDGKTCNTDQDNAGTDNKQKVKVDSKETKFTK